MIHFTAAHRTGLNRGLNLLLLLGGAVLAGSGWLLDERLPRGRDGRALSFFGLGRHDWGAIHAWVGYGLVALVVVHLLLHTAWLRRVATNGHPWRLVAGLAAAVVAVGVFVLVPVRG